MTTLSFYKTTEGNWFIDYPYPGPKEDLQMVAGADTMLDILSENSNYVTLNLAEENFAGATCLNFKEMATDIGNGAWYTIEEHAGIEMNLLVWLCDVTKFVLGYFPQRIYVKSIS